MELREQIARALINEIFGGTNDDVWSSWFPEADAVLEVIRPIIEERDALRAEIDAMKKQEPVAYLDFDVSKVTPGFRWDNVAQHHVPFLNVEFESVQANSPNDAKGWQDRDRLATMLNVLSQGEEK